MSKPNHNENQMLLHGMKEVVAAAIDKALTAPKIKDPRRELAKYPQRMTVAQVATFLNCAENHVFNLFDCGKLKGIDIALPGASRRCLRIFRDSVADYETKQNENPS
ncbi:MAG: hypothetical protein ABS95_02495 [Verrucomicrobia bacterium SCN 57-15]|nr:MAG: hypothetical protein ABS95_02495 [Verrucomicrobia bacterium SCN 57-15]